MHEEETVAAVQAAVETTLKNANASRTFYTQTLLPGVPNAGGAAAGAAPAGGGGGGGGGGGFGGGDGGGGGVGGDDTRRDYLKIRTDSKSRTLESFGLVTSVGPVQIEARDGDETATGSFGAPIVVDGGDGPPTASTLDADEFGFDLAAAAVAAADDAADDAGDGAGDGAVAAAVGVAAVTSPPQVAAEGNGDAGGPRSGDKRTHSTAAEAEEGDGGSVGKGIPFPVDSDQSHNAPVAAEEPPRKVVWGSCVVVVVASFHTDGRQ